MTHDPIRADRIKGPALMTLAALSITLAATLVKWASKAFSTEFVLLSRFASGTAIFALVYFRTFTGDVRGFVRSGVLWAQALTYVAALACLYLSIRFVSLVDALLLLNTAPLLAPLLALVFLGERQTAWSWTGILLGLAGVVIVLRPTASDFNAMSFLALGAGFLIAVRMVILSHMDRRLRKEQVAIGSQFSGMLIMGAATLVVGVGAPKWETILFPPRDWAAPWMDMPLVLVALIAFGSLSMVIPMFQAAAYRYGSVGEIGPFRYAAVIFAVPIDWVVWGQVPRMSSCIGFILIIVGAVLAALRLGKKG